MSLEVDLGEFLSAYLAEAEEHVAAANARLLALERAGGRDPRAVRELFRTLHTMKGLSAMVGVDAIVTLTHAMESVVRAADRAGGVLPSGTLEPLFEAVKACEERLAALAAGREAEPAPQALVARLERAPAEPGAAGGSARAASLDLDPALDAKLAPFEREQLASAAQQGRRAVRTEFVPSPKRAAEGLTITTVRERVAAIGDVVKVVPSAVPVSEEAPGGLRFVLLVVTEADDATIAAAAGGGEVVTIGGAPVSPALAEEPRAVEVASRNVLRVDVARVDDAIERLSALLVTRAKLARVAAELAAAGASTRELQATIQELTRQLRDMRGAVLGLRMVPFADVLSRLPLVLRRLERSSGKEVRLDTAANDAELDKGVAEAVFPAIVHLLRNAVDHGIEPANVRLERGKPPYGTVRVSCTTAANHQLLVRVADDGAGVDAEALARATGRPVEPTGAAMLEALCRPGISTRGEATATSGRGMGMDIVRKIVVDQLRGDLTLETTRGVGTIFTVRIPLTVAVIDAFCVRSGGTVYAVPVSIVEEVVEVEPDRVVHGPVRAGRRVSLLERRGEAVELVGLARALGGDDDEGRQALVVRRGGAAVAFRLERVLGQQETVVRPLVDPLVQSAGIAGSADLGDGRATLVLDLAALEMSS